MNAIFSGRASLAGEIRAMLGTHTVPDIAGSLNGYWMDGMCPYAETCLRAMSEAQVKRV